MFTNVATIALAAFDEVELAALTTPPDWFSDNPVWETAYDLGSCMSHNAAPFSHDEVKRVRTVAKGEEDGADWEWLVDLADGRRFYVIGGCDYTGWDCQSSAQYVEIPYASYGYS